MRLPPGRESQKGAGHLIVLRQRFRRGGGGGGGEQRGHSAQSMEHQEEWSDQLLAMEEQQGFDFDALQSMELCNGTPVQLSGSTSDVSVDGNRTQVGRGNLSISSQ